MEWLSNKDLVSKGTENGERVISRESSFGIEGCKIGNEFLGRKRGQADSENSESFLENFLNPLVKMDSKEWEMTFRFDEDENEGLLLTDAKTPKKGSLISSTEQDFFKIMKSNFNMNDENPLYQNFYKNTPDYVNILDNLERTFESEGENSVPALSYNQILASLSEVYKISTSSNLDQCMVKKALEIQAKLLTYAIFLLEKRIQQ